MAQQWLTEWTERLPKLSELTERLPRLERLTERLPRIEQLADRLPIDRGPRCSAGHASAYTLLGVAIGAGLMYLFDPAEGRRRRAQGRDQVVRLARRSSEVAESASRQTVDRAREFVRRGDPAVRKASSAEAPGA